jgi:anti-sigma factor RsiW
LADDAELTCKELVELVTDYLEGALPPAERVRFETHLVSCRGCANYLDQMRRTLDAVGALSEEAIDPDARDAFLEAFRSWKRTEAGGSA